MKSILAWHFVCNQLRNGDPVPADGVTLKFDGKLEMCASGLHASKRLIDALNYAPGETLCRVRCGGKIVHGSDKFICRERTILWRIDATETLRLFARKQAMSVAHLWDMPDVVRQYLETGNEKLRAAARSAVWDAAWTAARDAARSAVWTAARDAVWDAARDAAWTAAWTAARDAANKQLTKLVMEARKK